jgi:hypothetical protein
MKQIKRFEPLSVMKIAAICYALLGLMEGAIFSVVFSMVPFAGQDAPQFPRFFGLLFGGFAIIVFPVMFAVIGAIFGGLGAVVYNVSAKYVGGIRVEVEEDPVPAAGAL